ncbi:MAG: hypothetical protein RQ741_08965 [Wenzhouxiangellaceae bacterium]|nr:hypothetical protein [Wenzhouxiangellaceae bacterium]
MNSLTEARPDPVTDQLWMLAGRADRLRSGSGKSSDQVTSCRIWPAIESAWRARLVGLAGPIPHHKASFPSSIEGAFF